MSSGSVTVPFHSECQIVSSLPSSIFDTSLPWAASAGMSFSLATVTPVAHVDAFSPSLRATVRVNEASVVLSPIRRVIGIVRAPGSVPAGTCTLARRSIVPFAGISGSVICCLSHVQPSGPPSDRVAPAGIAWSVRLVTCSLTRLPPR